MRGGPSLSDQFASNALGSKWAVPWPVLPRCRLKPSAAQCDVWQRATV